MVALLIGYGQMLLGVVIGISPWVWAAIGSLVLVLVTWEQSRRLQRLNRLEHARHRRTQARQKTPNELAQEITTAMAKVELAGAKALAFQTDDEFTNWFENEFGPAFIDSVRLVNSYRAVYWPELMDALIARPKVSTYPEAMRLTRIWEARCAAVKKVLRKMLKSIRYD
jgi:hypothetical protein